MRRFGSWLFTAALVAVGALVSSAEGCSSDDDASPTPPTPDTAVDDSGGPDADDADDAGEVAPDAGSDEYPAFRPPMPKVLNSAGNPVVAEVTVVPVIFASDTSATIVTDFLAKYAASPEWTAQVKEYGVGKLTA